MHLSVSAGDPEHRHFRTLFPALPSEGEGRRDTYQLYAQNQEPAPLPLTGEGDVKNTDSWAGAKLSVCSKVLSRDVLK